MAQGTGDISEDYNDYAGEKVTLSGAGDGTYALARWTDETMHTRSASCVFYGLGEAGGAERKVFILKSSQAEGFQEKRLRSDPGYPQDRHAGKPAGCLRRRVGYVKICAYRKCGMRLLLYKVG